MAKTAKSPHKTETEALADRLAQYYRPEVLQ